MSYSLVLPFHRDLTSLGRTVQRVLDEGARHGVVEVLLAHNGDPLTPPALETAASFERPASGTGPSVRLLHTDAKGIGAGYKLGIREARADYVILSADDLPFGWSDLESFEREGRPAFAVGSKAHPDSKLTGIEFRRRVVSFCFRTMRQLVLGRNTPGDSQGTLIVESPLAKRLEPELVYDDYLFSLEFATMHLARGGKVIELPVVYEHIPHPSSVSVVRDGVRMGKELLAIRLRIRSSA
jgi:hypothetical protein